MSGSIFTLEALNARHGDALLLHYGPKAKPKLVLIDGGPRDVYAGALRPRLVELRQRRAPDGALAIRMVVVSHIDDDHIRGILDFADELLSRQDAGQPPLFDTPTLWHNSFEDLIDGVDPSAFALLRSLAAAGAGGGGALPAAFAAIASAGARRDAAAIVASVGQGRRLRDLAAQLDWNLNHGFGGGPIVAPQSGALKKALGSGLAATIVGPGEDQLDALEAEWEKSAAALGRGAGPSELAVLAAAFVDRSVANLSSIVMLAAFHGKTMLLTGDARGDHVLARLEAAGLLAPGGSMAVDLLKVPHHGSARNVAPVFFERVRADHYVISADGEHGNPDRDMLDMLVQARGQAVYTIHLTNRVPHAETFLKQAKAGRKFRVRTRAGGALGLRVDLLDPLPD